METFDVHGGALEFQVRGEGAALVLAHGSVFADAWEPMLSHAGLLSSYQVVTLRRRGYGGSSPAQPGRTLRDEGADVVALLDHLGIGQAHAGGHSLGASIVLQAVIDAPDRFSTMTLLEPGMPSVPSASGMDQVLSGITQVFESGDHRQAMLRYLGGADGAGLMARLEKKLPDDAGEMAVADAAALFELDVPAGRSWELDEDAARSLRQPTLLALGSDTGPIYRESNAVIAGLLTEVEQFEVADAGHFVHIEQAERVADALAAFLKRTTSQN
jgi:pimeloyl-ACP methyl ester carboxylesterase